MIKKKNVRFVENLFYQFSKPKYYFNTVHTRHAETTPVVFYSRECDLCHSTRLVLFLLLNSIGRIWTVFCYFFNVTFNGCVCSTKKMSNMRPLLYDQNGTYYKIQRQNDLWCFLIHREIPRFRTNTSNTSSLFQHNFYIIIQIWPTSLLLYYTTCVWKHLW